MAKRSMAPGVGMRARLFAGLVLINALAAADGEVQGIEVVGTRFEVTMSDGRVLTQNQLIGAELSMMDPAGNVLVVRIDDTEPDPDDASGEILLYTFLVQDAGTGAWRNLCNPGADGVAKGFPLSGVQIGGARDDPATGDSFSLTCTSGANGKCVRLGYKPWKMGSDGRPLRDYHQACVRMMRADYCGDGTGHTRDGTAINVYDRLGIQKPDPEPSEFEAAWSPAGAVCVRKPRIPDLVTLDELVEMCPERLRDRTGGDCAEAEVMSDEQALVLNRS